MNTFQSIKDVYWEQKKVKRLVEFSPNDNKHTANKSKAIISQTLPKHPFMEPLGIIH